MNRELQFIVKHSFIGTEFLIVLISYVDSYLSVGPYFIDFFLYISLHFLHHNNSHHMIWLSIHKGCQFECQCFWKIFANGSRYVRNMVFFSKVETLICSSCDYIIFHSLFIKRFFFQYQKLLKLCIWIAYINAVCISLCTTFFVDIRLAEFILLRENPLKIWEWQQNHNYPNNEV